MTEFSCPKTLRSVAIEIEKAAQEAYLSRLRLSRGDIVADWLYDKIESILRNEWRSIVAECAVENKDLLREILTPKETTNAG